mgnify:FL=1
MVDLLDRSLSSVLSGTDLSANIVGGSSATESGKKDTAENLPRVLTDECVGPYLRTLILALSLFKPKPDCLNKAAFA